MQWQGKGPIEPPVQDKGVLASVWETIKTIFWALLIAGLFRTLLFQPFWIPSGSMKDTLLIGDFLFVNKFAYGYSYASCPAVRIAAVGIDLDQTDFCGFLRQEPDGSGERYFGRMPQRGDVVVFRHPVDGIDMIKRLIGLPGDTVQMRGGVVYLNGEPLPQEPAGEFIETYAPQGSMGGLPDCVGGRPAPGAECVNERFRETLPEGLVHDVLNTATTPQDDTPVFTVPPNHFFFLGDNRDQSADSRFPRDGGYIGFVPFENLIGRADRVMFSSAGRSILAFWTWRSDRYFHAIE